MERWVPTVIIALVVLTALALMIVGWKRRGRAQASMPMPASVPTEVGAELWRGSGLYVATTRGGDRLDRVAVHGLGFRARTEVIVHEAGLVLALRGNEPIFLPRRAIKGIGRATWAIDRVVEPGGLVVIDWALEGIALDSYLRMSPPDTAALLAAAEFIVTTPTEGHHS